MKRIISLLLVIALLAGCAAAEGQPGSLYSSATAVEETAQKAQETETAQQDASEGWSPTDKVKLLVAYKEGSSTDRTARLLAQYAEKYVGQTIEVRNIAADSGIRCWETLAQSEPDGTVIGVLNLPNFFSAMENGGDFSLQSFEPICNHVTETSVVIVPENSPYNTLEELVEANIQANSENELLRCATNGVQASNDIGAALLAYVSGDWKFRHVSYGSTGDEINALLTGECDWAVAKVSDVLEYLDESAMSEDDSQTDTDTESYDQTVDSTQENAVNYSEQEAEETTQQASETTMTDAHTDLGTSEHLRVLGVFNTERCEELPNVPTLDELGYVTGWNGSIRAIVAPEGTPDNIIQFYAEAFKEAMEDPECIQAHQDAGLTLDYRSPEDLSSLMEEQERFSLTLLPKLFS